ncbi:hypothetical protein E8F20_09120 [Pseudomonas sp. BN415]|nr:hypothetical protein [Pseudomonas sp. BN415]
MEAEALLISTTETFAVGRAAVPQFVRASVSNASGDDGRLLEAFQALADALRQEVETVDT